MKVFASIFAGRRVLFGLWALVCLVALLVTLKLSVFMFSPSQTSYSMLPSNDFMTHHSCFSAYVAAADRLGEPGARLYDPAGYERRGDDEKRRIPLGDFEQDQFEYPPTFLLLPKALLLVSHSFPVLRALWFVLTMVTVLGAMGVTAAWIGGRAGLATALLIPTFWGTFSNLLTVQTGNVQFIIYVTAILGMIAFHRERPALGGAMLAFAIGAKLYPGVLVLFLLARRRWNEALWTLGFGALYCGAILAIAGFAPFYEFLTFQLPRLLSGEAFGFFKKEIESMLTNGSIFGLPYKLHYVGLVTDPDRIAPVLSRIYSVLLVVATVVAARKAAGRRALADSRESRAVQGILWMAILNLAVLQGPFVPPYGLLGTVWMMTLWAPLGRRFWKTAALFVAGWASLTILIPEPRTALMVTGFLSMFSNFGINIAMLVYALRWRPERAEEPPAETGEPSGPSGTAQGQPAA